jgi:hypothetical protein
MNSRPGEEGGECAHQCAHTKRLNGRSSEIYRFFYLFSLRSMLRLGPLFSEYLFRGRWTLYTHDKARRVGSEDDRDEV